MGNLLDEFKFPNLPASATEFLSQEMTQKASPGVRGVADFEVSGYEKQGLAYRFYLHPVKSQAKSDEFDMEINDEVEMIQWFKNKTHKPVERVTELPEQLLKFAKKRISANPPKWQFVRDENGKLECKSGIYKEAYINFQRGLGATGLALDRWDKLSLGQVQTLKSEGIFTVQQFAALPTERVEGRFPKDLIRAFNDAIHYCNAEQKRIDITPYANELLALRQEASKKDDQIRVLQEEMKKTQEQMVAVLQASSTPPVKKRTRRTKEQMERARKFKEEQAKHE